MSCVMAGGGTGLARQVGMAGLASWARALLSEEHWQAQACSFLPAAGARSMYDCVMRIYICMPARHLFTAACTSMRSMVVCHLASAV